MPVTSSVESLRIRALPGDRNPSTSDGDSDLPVHGHRWEHAGVGGARAGDVRWQCAPRRDHCAGSGAQRGTRLQDDGGWLLLCVPREWVNKARVASRARHVSGNRCPCSVLQPRFRPRTGLPKASLARGRAGGPSGAHSGTRQPTPPAAGAVPSRGSRGRPASPDATRSLHGPGITPSCDRTAA